MLLRDCSGFCILPGRLRCWIGCWLHCARVTMTERSVRLLLVEDDPDLSRAVARSLRRHDLEVTAAPSCATALALCCSFDIAVFDIGLADGDGLALAARLLDEACVDRAVIFSAVEDPAVLRRASRLGPVVRKRDGVDALVQVVLGLLGSKAVTRSGILSHGDGQQTRPGAKTRAG
jgi:CheY-like chemotaxis protein